MTIHFFKLSWQSRVQEETAAEHVILEVERLWPPFFGGARVCTEVVYGNWGGEETM